MKKLCIHFFCDLLNAQECWLNKMASIGYRLVNTGIFTYEFIPCDANRYKYCVEFISHRSAIDVKNYVHFLNDLGYNTFYKNINLSYYIFKFKWRPWIWNNNQFAIGRRNLGKEILIIEKENDGTPLEMYSTLTDKQNYYKALRLPYSFLSIFTFLLGAFCRTWVVTLLSIPFLLHFSFYQYKIFKIGREKLIEEY